MLLLTILDGWGESSQAHGNAIVAAKTPFFDKMNRDTPKTVITASGLEVGLPEGQMGNSEVGHLNMGAGRVLYQNLPMISKAIYEGTFYENTALSATVNRVNERGSSLHLVGLLSDGGVHSHMDHLFALMEMAKRRGVGRVFIHVLLDGRDTPPRSAKKYLEQLENKIEELQCGKIATVMGRYYGMDRDNRWERVHEAYLALVYGKGEKAENPISFLNESYENGVNDEFVKPGVMGTSSDQGTSSITNEDSVVFFNFRADRMRQIVRTFFDKTFSEFDRGSKPSFPDILCMTEYDSTFGLPCVYPPDVPHNTLGEFLSVRGISQLHVAETEKYAHVTFFFNGGKEEPFTLEDRILIPSPKVATYDMQPEMSALQVKDAVIEAIQSGKYEFIVVNFANPDMVGHTGIMEAAIKAVETIDSCVQEVVEAAKSVDATVLITSDHGNVEEMIGADGGICTAHTTNQVPFYCLSDKNIYLRDGGKLADVAPTILKLLGLDQPEEMTGEPLVV